MRAYYFSECPYPDVWPRSDHEYIRGTLPNTYCDPRVAADLINYRLDEWLLADEIGMDIMINEHRSSATCITASCMPPGAMLAKMTQKARILLLGPTIGMRRDPVGIAEELAYIDVVSRGRLEFGLLKGYPAEVAPSNMNPASLAGRYVEARDLILKALTYRDGPFNWEGEHFHYRQVNIWPRPYQDPHPPVWVTCFSPFSAVEVANQGYVCAASVDANLALAIFNTYRRRCAELGRPNPNQDRFAYMALIGLGNTEEEGLERLGKVRGWTWSSGITPPQLMNPPGAMPIPGAVAAMKKYPDRSNWATRATGLDGSVYNPSADAPKHLISSGMGFGGTPDQVFEQIKACYTYLGGFGHLNAMMHGGDLSHEDTTDSMRLFAREVLPRLKELVPPEPVDFRAQIEAARV